MAGMNKSTPSAVDKAPAAPQRPVPRPPQGQKATPQQQGNQPTPSKTGASPSAGTPGPGPATTSKPGSAGPQRQPGSAPGSGSGGNPPSPLGPRPPSGSPEQAGGAKGPSPGPGPDQPMPLQEGNSKELSSAIEFLNNYIKSGMPDLPAGMLSGINPETSPSALDQIGTKLPTTVAGDIKTFPKYSLATGSASSPNLPTGMNIPQMSVSEPNLIAGLPKSQVQIQQMKLNNVQK